jgi:hypothetical protein
LTLPPAPVAFYCVADSKFFLGAVAMLNSLRLLDHREPVYVLDCGLTERQRELLAPHVTVVPTPRHGPPYLLKTIAPLRHPAEVTVLIDTDIIVTRPLTELIERASQGTVAAFRTAYDRFFPQWGELLGLGTVRRRPYLCSALVFLGGEEGRQVLRHMDQGQARVPRGMTRDPREFFKDVERAPLQLGDQDVLNAVLAARPDPERTVTLEHRLAPEPPFAGLRLLDADALGCVHEDGTEPYVLHHLGPKPWLVPMRESPYSRLLTRLLVGPGLAIEVPEADVPLRLRQGLMAGASRTLAGLRHRFRASVREPLAWRVGAGTGALRDRLTRGAGPAQGPG